MVRKGGPACPKCARNGAPGRTTIDIIYTSGTYLAERTSNTLAILEPTTPLTATRAVWVVVRWSLGGGVASTRSEGDCSQRTALFSYCSSNAVENAACIRGISTGGTY